MPSAAFSKIYLFAVKRVAMQSVLLVTCFLALQVPVAAESQLYLTEDEVAERSDWVMVVDAVQLPNYMKYPGSHLFPITQIRVNYLNCLSDTPTRPIHYEDFWYHDGQPVGCRRYNLVDLNQLDRRGTIYVKAGKGTSANTAAVANVIVRLSVELNVHEASAAVVLVPEEVHRQLVSDFGSIGFFKRAVQGGAQIAIRLVSNPRVFDEYLYYKVSN